MPTKLILCKFSFSNHRSSCFLKCLHIVSVSFPFRDLIIRCLSNDLGYISSTFCRSKWVYTVLIQVIKTSVNPALCLIIVSFI
nr:MAG TPA_asm: hypothetical protein [Caudoviricetes sp.]